MIYISEDGKSGDPILLKHNVVCDTTKLKQFDMNFALLITVAILIVGFAVRTKQLRVIEETGDAEEQETTVGTKQAVMFFFVASSVLLCLYLFMDTLSIIFTILISFSCFGAVAIVIEEFFLHLFDGRDNWFMRNHNLRFVGDMSWASAFSFAVSLTVVITWAITRNWLLNNIMAACICILFLKTIKQNSLMPGVVLLSLLFFYDIFWVFFSGKFTGGESVMVAVARGVDIPIKLWMPHITSAFPTTACSLLGLGDILIPGIFIGFMTRFGLEVKKTNAYFIAAMIAYTLSLFLCGFVLFVFHQAQPALFYIVPALFIAVFGLGAARGDIQQMIDGIPRKMVVRVGGDEEATYCELSSLPKKNEEEAVSSTEGSNE